MQSLNKLGRWFSILTATAMLTAAATAVLAASPRAAEHKIVLIANQDPGTLDYVTSVLTAMLLWIPTNVVEPLVYFKDDGSAEPGVAESWKISDDRLTYEFTIRDAKFSDGTPVTVEDVIYSMKTMKASPVALYAGAYDAVTAIDKVDDHRVRVTLSRPSHNFWFAMGSVAGLIQPEHAAGSRVTNPIGTGPYRLKSYTSNSTLEFEANPYYWGPKPSITDATVRIIEDNTTILNALEAGEADGFPAAEGNLLEQLTKRGLDKKFQLVPVSAIGEPNYVVLNQKLDPDLRKALAMTLDRASFTAAFAANSGVVPTCTFAMPNRAWYAPESTEACPYPFDYAKATAEASKYTAPLEFASFTGMGWLGDIAIPSVQGAGFNVTRTDLDLARYSQLIFEGRPPQFDMTVMSGPDTPAQFVCPKPDAAGWSTYCSQAYTNAFVAADSALNDDEYLAKMKEAAKILRDDAVIVPLFDEPGVAILDPGLHGYMEPRVQVAVELASLHW